MSVDRLVLTDDGACPFLREDRCTAREHRTLGCRTFYCDKATAPILQALHEKYLARIKALADRAGMPCTYGRVLEE